MKPCPFCAEMLQPAAIVCRFCGRELAPDRVRRIAEGGATRTRLADRVGGWGLGALGLAALVAALAAGLDRLPQVTDRNTDPGSRVDPLGLQIAALAAIPPRPEPVVRPEVTVPIPDRPDLRVPAGEYATLPFQLAERDRACTLRGRVVGLDGGQRDVQLWLLDDDALAALQNDEPPVPLYETGQRAEHALAVPLPGPGTYHLVVSNAFSHFTDKTVATEGLRVVCPKQVELVEPGS